MEAREKERRKEGGARGCGKKAHIREGGKGVFIRKVKGMKERKRGREGMKGDREEKGVEDTARTNEERKMRCGERGRWGLVGIRKDGSTGEGRKGEKARRE